jgi:hypothetical protein
LKNIKIKIDSQSFDLQKDSGMNDVKIEINDQKNTLSNPEKTNINITNDAPAPRIEKSNIPYYQGAKGEIEHPAILRVKIQEGVYYFFIGLLFLLAIYVSSKGK